MSNLFESKKALRMYGFIALGASAVCVILRLICVFFFFDSEIGYYTSISPLPIILNAVLCLTAVGALAFCLVPKIKISPVTPTLTKSIRISAIFPAVGFAAYAVVYFSWLAEYVSIYGAVPFAYILTAIATIGACAFFCLDTFRKNNSDILYVITGALTVVWFVIALADCYFDTLVQMNSPSKLVFQFACLAGMLITVNEIRQGFEFKRASFHLFSASIACVFLLTSSIPSIIGHLTGNMPITYSLLYSDAVFLLLSVFAVSRLIQMCFGKEPEVVSQSDVSDSEVIEKSEQKSENTPTEDTAEPEDISCDTAEDITEDT